MIDASATSRLHGDAVTLATDWVPTDDSGHRIRQRFLDLLADQPEAVVGTNPGAHITASALVVESGLERVLLCLHGRIGKWVQLGGHLESVDGSVAAGALREAREESGIEGLMLHPVPIDLDIHPVTCRNGASWHYDVRFAVLAPPGAIATISAESRQLGWFAPDALPTPLASATDRLVRPALEATRRM